MQSYALTCTVLGDYIKVMLYNRLFWVGFFLICQWSSIGGSGSISG